MRSTQRTERSLVSAVLGGVCALGALSSIVPTVGAVLLGLLGLGLLAGLVGVCRVWHATRFRAPDPVSHLPAHTHTERKAA